MGQMERSWLGLGRRGGVHRDPGLVMSDDRPFSTLSATHRSYPVSCFAIAVKPAYLELYHSNQKADHGPKQQRVVVVEQHVVFVGIETTTLHDWVQPHVIRALAVHNVRQLQYGWVGEVVEVNTGGFMFTGGATSMRKCSNYVPSSDKIKVLR